MTFGHNGITLTQLRNYFGHLHRNFRSSATADLEPCFWYDLLFRGSSSNSDPPHPR